ncbi:MAG: NAD(P)/FAD-dependent oxidoreductase [Woeseia sp.]
MGVSAKEVTVIGAGLCGSLIAIMLKRRGLGVSLLERCADPRTSTAIAGRSINLALSTRGIRALQNAGIFSNVEPLLMPMRGRLIHAEDGTTELQPYGQTKEEQIHSVSRAELNRILIDTAHVDCGIRIRFQQEAIDYDGSGCNLHMLDLVERCNYELHARPIIAADGAGSAIRRSLSSAAATEAAIGATESILPHGYKELSIPAGPGGRHQLDPGALHIWPRGGFMLIALPNPGGDFTLTLFLPNDGKESFSTLTTAAEVTTFFGRYFADVMPLIPDLTKSFLGNPLGILGTVRCRHWHNGGKLLLIGDAAHAIVPFHGQGMNLAFEDCVLLDRIVCDGSGDWAEAFAGFEKQQLDNANAIADMALENYVEMRDTVRDPKFKLRKELSFELERRLPGRFIPRYSMVMFHDEIPYAVAQARGALQQELLDELMQNAGNLAEIDIDAAEVLVRERLPRLRS